MIKSIQEAIEQLQKNRIAGYVQPNSTLFVFDLMQKLAEQERMVQRVRELHRPYTPYSDEVFCTECHGDNDFGEWGQYPCQTIKTLDGEQ